MFSYHISGGWSSYFFVSDFLFLNMFPKLYHVPSIPKLVNELVNSNSVTEM